MRTNFADCFEIDMSQKTINGLDDFGMPDLISKYAGIQITNPTRDNVEDFIRSYVENEVAGMPEKVIFLKNLEIMHDSYNDKHELISAIGNVTLGIKDANGTIVLPFTIEDSELNPFDVIQVNNERVPFTRINLAKVINGIRHQEKDPSFGDPASMKKYKPFLGVDEKINNATTSEGFLGNILSVQDKYRTGNSNAGEHYVTAEEILSLTEKVAALKEKVVFEIEKTAGAIEMEKIDKKQEEMLTKVASLNWTDISECKTGDYISIPTVKKVPGLTDEAYVEKALVVERDNDKVVITKDNKMAILKQGEKMACIKETVQPFKFSVTKLSSLDAGDRFIYFRGNDIIGPCEVHMCYYESFYDVPFSGGDLRVETARAGREKKIFSLLARPVGYEYSSYKAASKDKIAVYEAPGRKFVKVTKSEMRNILSKEFGIDEVTIVDKFYRLSPCNDDFANNTFATDKDTNVIAITGKFEGFLERPEDLQYFGTEKTASASGRCEIYKRDNTFNVKISYSDKSKKVLSERVKEFKNIEDYRVKGILKTLGFDGQDSGEIVWKAKNQGSAIVSLPDEEKALDIVGANENSKIKNTAVKVIKSNGFDRVGKDILANFTYQLADFAADPSGVSQIVLASHKDELMEKTAKYLTKRANTAKDLAGEFEKVAVECKSDKMRTVASMMVLGSEMYKKASTFKTYEGSEKIAADILSNKDSLEKTAYDLINLSLTERRNKNYIVHPAFLKEAVIILDEMVKIASSMGKENQND